MTTRTLNIIGLLAVLAMYVTVAGSVPALAQDQPPVPQYEDVAPPAASILPAEISAASTSIGVLPVEPTMATCGIDSLPTEVTSAGGGVNSLSAVPETVNSGIDSLLAIIEAFVHTGPAGIGVESNTASVPSTAMPSPWSPWWASFAGDVDTAIATALVLACDDAVTLREYLFANSITVRVGGSTRALPQDFFAGVTAYEYADAYCQADQDVLENVAPPGDVTVLRFVNRGSQAATFALTHPGRKYLVITDTNGLSVDALRVLAGSNVIGVIVGHYRHADDEPVDFAASTADVMRVTRTIRLISDAPVLLAVGVVNVHTRDTERSWADAFGDDLKTFDGFALYGLTRFPAILEAAENPRELILRRMGLPEKPCVLIEFMGTSYQYAASERPYVEKVWATRAKPLIAAMKKQQWHGLVTWSVTADDARIKADALRNAMK